MTGNVLVTGAQGFVGRYLVAQLLAVTPARVVGIGRAARCENFTHHVSCASGQIPGPLTAHLLEAQRHERYTYVTGDIRDAVAMQDVLDQYRPEVIYHLASGLRDDHPRHLFGTSVEGTVTLLHAVCKTGIPVRAIVIASSGSVYGIPRRLPVAEDHPCEPRDLYAVSKLSEEHVSRIIGREQRLPIIAARIFNIVGPGQDERHATAAFAAQLALIAAGKADAVLRVGDLSTSRDFIDVRDVAGALVLLAARGGTDAVFNVASGVETRMADILDILVDAADISGHLPLDVAYARASDIPRVAADITRIRSIGYEERFPLRRSLSDVLRYYTEMVPAGAVH